jgi:hypothetical protein
MPFTVPPAGGFFERLVYALTASNLSFYVLRIWGGPTQDASIQAEELALAAWVLTMFVLTLFRWLGRRQGEAQTGEFPQYRGPSGSSL